PWYCGRPAMLSQVDCQLFAKPWSWIQPQASFLWLPCAQRATLRQQTACLVLVVRGKFMLDQRVPRSMVVRYSIPTFVTAVVLIAGAAAQDEGKTSDTRTPRQRGSLAVRGQPAMNPPLWSAKAYGTLWQRWGVAEKPADFTQQVQERYGLHASP